MLATLPPPRQDGGQNARGSVGVQTQGSSHCACALRALASRRQLRGTAFKVECCQRVISDYEQIYEVAQLTPSTVLSSILMGLFAAGTKIRATLQTHNEELWK
eukprot:3293852-Amphidinium_carterae.1